MKSGEALDKASAMLSHAQHWANHDVLTGLANRELFKEILKQQLAVCERESGYLSVLYIDLDGFKGVNDAHSHATGDKLLRVVAERLKSGIREFDVAARLGGDEFSVLLLTAKAEEATLVAQKIVASLETLYQIEHLIIKISTSIGIASYPENGTTGKVLLHSADD
jgi:diguanylate cyclase (GGDEF)-like protein